MKTVAIITAAGQGKRMGGPKQFVNLAGKPMLEWTLAVFDQSEVINEIVLVVNEAEIERTMKFKFRKLKRVVAGGKARQDSVYNGLKTVADDFDLVLIHDGARPFVTNDIITRAVKAAAEHGAVVVGVPVKDTIKAINNLPAGRQGEQLTINKTLDRRKLWQAQTPQVFKRKIIVEAYDHMGIDTKVTDDAALVEKLGLPVKMIMGSYSNIKITTSEDLQMAETILQRGAKR